MTTAIAVTSAELALPAGDPHTPAAHLLSPPARQSLDDALSEMRVVLEQHGYLIVLHSSAVAPAVRQRLHAVRSILESDRIALVRSELPPLALGVLVRQLRRLSTADFSPGVLAGAIRLLSHYIHAGALLNSVAKLDNVRVPLTSHAKSWLPGSQFAVLASPEPQLIKVGSGGGAALKAPEFATCLTTAAGGLHSGWVDEQLAERWRVASLEPVALPGESARWWGTGKLIEFAAAIPDISLLYQLVCSVQRADCHWCGLELIGDRCVFCRAPVGADTGALRAAAATAASTRGTGVGAVGAGGGRTAVGPLGRTAVASGRTTSGAGRTAVGPAVPPAAVPPVGPAAPVPPVAPPPAPPAVPPPGGASGAPQGGGPQPGDPQGGEAQGGGASPWRALHAPPPVTPPHAASRLTQARTTRLTPLHQPPQDTGQFPTAGPFEAAGPFDSSGGQWAPTEAAPTPPPGAAGPYRPTADPGDDERPNFDPPVHGPPAYGPPPSPPPTVPDPRVGGTAVPDAPVPPAPYGGAGGTYGSGRVPYDSGFTDGAHREPYGRFGHGPPAGPYPYEPVADPRAPEQHLRPAGDTPPDGTTRPQRPEHPT